MLTHNQYIIIWKSNVDEECKGAVYGLLDKCSPNMKLGRGIGLIDGFGIVASRNAFINCIVRNPEGTPEACDGASSSPARDPRLFRRFWPKLIFCQRWRPAGMQVVRARSRRCSRTASSTSRNTGSVFFFGACQRRTQGAGADLGYLDGFR